MYFSLLSLISFKKKMVVLMKTSIEKFKRLGEFIKIIDEYVHLLICLKYRVKSQRLMLYIFNCSIGYGIPSFEVRENIDSSVFIKSKLLKILNLTL